MPPELSVSEALGALRRAAAAWSAAPCTQVSISIVETTLRGGALRDRTSTIAFHRRYFCKEGIERAGACYDPRSSAMTTVHLADDDPLPSGELPIVEADIELNAVSFRWTAGESRSLSGSVPQPASGRVMDLETVLLHELGHVLGLAHICEHGKVPSHRRDARGKQVPQCARAPSGVRASVMVPAGDVPLDVPIPIKHALAPDDERGACELYPKPAPATAGCGCGVLGGAIGSAEATAPNAPNPSLGPRVRVGAGSRDSAQVAARGGALPPGN